MVDCWVQILVYSIKRKTKFPLVPMGAAAPGYGNARPSTQAQAQVSGRGNLTNVPINLLVISGNSKNFLVFPLKKT